MIPLRLELTNFLSYRETAVLDFNGIHLACISGLNGSGKSTILDAITWVLFGQSRSKSDDDLVNRLSALDGSEAAVLLDFDLEGATYRVLRRKKPGKTTRLEFQVATGTDSWKTLTESKIKETEAAIETLLHMNYDTFVNASFFLQGQADEFTTKTPNKRKEVLADLLGVSQWDRYKEAVAVQRRESEGKVQLHEGLLADIAEELGLDEERQLALADVEKAQAEISLRLQDKEQLLAQLRRAETAVQQQKQMVQNLTNSMERIKRSLTSLQKSRQQRQVEHDAYAAILAAGDEILAQFALYQEREAAVQGWQAKADAHNQLQQARRPHELSFTQAQSRLEQQQKELTLRAAQVETAVTERNTVVATLTANQSEMAELTNQLTALAEQEQAYQAAREALQALQNSRQLLTQQQTQLRQEQQRVQLLADERQAVIKNRDEAEKQEAIVAGQVSAIAETHKKHATYRAEHDNLVAVQPRLRQEMEKLKERIDRLQEDSGGQCPLCGQPLTDDHRQQVLLELEGDGKEAGDRFRTNRERIAYLMQEVAALEKLLKQSDRLDRDLTAQRQRLHKAEARLTEIDQALAEWDDSGRAAELAKLTNALADETAVLAHEATVKELEKAVAAKTTLSQKQQTLQKAQAQAEARLGEIDRLVGEWEAAGQAALADVTRRLQEQDFATDAQAALTQLDAEIDVVGYVAADHQQAREALQDLSAAPARFQEYQQAQAAVKPLLDGLADLDRQIADLEAQLLELTAQQKTAVVELDKISADSGDLRAIETEVQTLREEQIAATQRVGAAQQKLAVLDDLRDRQQKLLADKAEITQRVQRLKLLEKACGRDGVQALLIEQALPDIEDRANELLERLTGGEMRVSFETQRQLKSRDAVVETLDLRIIDNAGERPYANFSGGEQFRVNFAVRLALSQVLAHRSGASLKTLVVDEGFGSQDPNGRQRLVEAINTIQNEFERILVITHIAELRDAFPTRIEVEKGVGGSTIRVI